MSQGKIITFEGIECSGKDLQAESLRDYLSDRPTLLTREPGGALYGETLRALIKHPEKTIASVSASFMGHEDFPNQIAVSSDFSRSPYCELFMYLAARAEFVSKVVKPAFEDGQIVIINRCYDSTRAYQGGGRFHHDKQMIENINLLNRIAMQGIVPDLTIWLDISIQEMIDRRKNESDKDAFFEKTCDRDFFERARTEYGNIAQEEPDRFKRFEGGIDARTIRARIITMVENLLKEEV